jgi:hypothetical protein
MSQRLTAPLRFVVWLLAAETVALAALTVALIVFEVRASGPSLRNGVVLVGFVIVMAVITGGLSWALSRLRFWARGPAIVLQMLLLPLGYYMLTGGLTLVGLLIMAIGLAGTGVLIAPSTRITLGGR